MNFALIRKSIPILDLARRLGIEVNHNRARCIFPERHKNNDRTPSLTINPKTNTFKCWVCDDVRGSVIDLVMMAGGVDFKAAIAYLTQEGWVDEKPDYQPPVAAKSPVPTQRPMETDGAGRFEIYDYFFGICEDLSPEDLRYLKSRRIFRKTAEKMNLRSILNYEETSARLEQKYDIPDLQAAGIFNDKGHLRFYKHRLILPYFHEGKVCYFQARATDPAVTPKELNPSGAIPVPYNIDIVKTSALVYLCEGVIDSLTLIEQGFPAVGIPGAKNFKAAWMPLFKGKRVFSCFDADTAGHAGNEKLKALFAEHKIYFDIIKIPEGADINDLFTGKKWKNPKSS